MNNVLVSAAYVDLVRCETCGLTCQARRSREAGSLYCERCRGALHPHKPNSLERSTAFLVAAAFLYIPANILPVMTITMLGSGHPDTILSGVKALIHAGMWPLAMLVFFASFVVPMAKMLSLAYLIVSVRCGSATRLRDRTRLYYFTEAVGRWSMIDVYVVTVLVALVKLGSIATIEPGLGAMAFGAVVVLTMLSAMAFDSRLIWAASGVSK